MSFDILVSAKAWARPGVTAFACALALASQGCANIDATCSTNADCKKPGTICKVADGDTVGICITSQKTTCDKVCADGYKCSHDTVGNQTCAEDPNAACTLPCGDGFKCQWTEPDWHMACVIDSGADVAVGITSPATGGVIGDGTQTIVCTAKAPQLQTVVVHVKDESGATTDLSTTLASGSATDYEASIDTTSEPEGDLTITCEMSYGPSEAVQDLTSDPVTVTLDRTAPTIDSTAPEGWHQPTGSLTVTATITDAGAKPVGVDKSATKLTIQGQDIAPTVSGSTYSFAIDLTTVQVPSGGGTVSYSVQTADKAGNVANATGSIEVDDTPPTIAMEGDPSTQWHGGDAPTFSVTATVTSTGAPVDANTVKLSLTDGTHAVTGVSAGGDAYTFNLDASTLESAGAEGAVAFFIKSDDVAGNEVSLPGTLKLDEKGPSLALTPDVSWHGGSETVPLAVTLDDGGAGLDATSVSVSVNGGDAQACARGSGTGYTCNVSTSGAPANATTAAYGYVITAKDVLGNRTSQNGSLQVDTEAPVLTTTPDTKWHGRADPVTVTVTAVDDGAGLGTNAPVLETVDTADTQTAKSYEMTASGGNAYSVTLTPSDFLKPGLTVASYAMQARVSDRVGNEATVPLTLKFDEEGPSVSVTPDASWHRRTGTFAVTATIGDSGSGLALAPPTLTVTDARATTHKVYTGTASGGTYGFTVNPSDFMPSGHTYSDFAFEIESADAVGNPTTATLTRKLDDEAPTVNVATDTSWHARGETMTVTATITDAGGLSGTAPTLETNDTANTTTPESYPGSGSGTYTFTFSPTDFLKSGVTVPAYAFRIRVKDVAGNEAVTDLTRKFDDQGPGITVNSDPQWYPKSGDIVVTATLSDTGSGVSSTPPTLTVSDSSATTHKVYDGQDTGGGNYSFSLAPADFMPGGQTFPAFSFRIDAADATGNTANTTLTRKLDDQPPSISVISDSTWYGKAQTVTVHATIADAGSGLNASTVKLATNDANSTTTTKTYDGTCNGSDCTFTFQGSDFIKTGLTLNDLALRVTAADQLANAGSSDTSRNFDDQAPTITFTPPTQKLLRNNTSVALTATVSDMGKNAAGADTLGAGVDDAAVILSYTKKDGSTASVTGTAGGGGTYTWNFDASSPQLNAAEGPVTLTVKAADADGNAGSQNGNVTISRVLWDFAAGNRINGSVAYSAGSIYFTTFANGIVSEGATPPKNLFAVNASNGAETWSTTVAGLPTGPVSVGASDLYLAYTDGSGLGNLAAYPKSGGSTDWTCLNIGVASGGLAVSSWDWSGTGDMHETVVAATSKNKADAMIQNGTTCTQAPAGASLSDPELSGVSVDGNRIWFGTAIAKMAVSTFVSADQNFTNGVSLSDETGGDPVAGAALRSVDHGAVAAHQGQLKLWSTSLSSGFSAAISNKQIFAPPSLAADDTAYVGTPDGLLYKFVLPTATPASGFPLTLPGNSPLKTSPTIDSADNVIVTTSDGLVRVYSSSGTQLWSYDTFSSGQLTSPSLSCSGVLYIGTNTGHVIALQGDGGGLKNSSWPRYQHDNRNTGNLATAIYSGSTCQD